MSYDRLIQEWLPIREISIECQRERGASSALPPLYFLHVWWARRPLIASRAAILSSLLPAWKGNESKLNEWFTSEDEYHRWFMSLLGIKGDVVAAREKTELAMKTGDRIANPFESRAFTTSLSENNTNMLRQMLHHYSGIEYPSVLDSMAGGGSIPFEVLRLSLKAIATELNPVASVVLKGTLDYPFFWGQSLTYEIEQYGKEWLKSITEALDKYYINPNKDEILLSYLWARAVPCPSTGKPVPLSPNWWLRLQPDDSVCVEPVFKDGAEAPQFIIRRGTQKQLEERYSPGTGTVKRGNAVSPWSGDPVSSDYIKQCAQEGSMGAILYAVVVDRGKGRDFRDPSNEDLEGIRRAEMELKNKWVEWETRGLIPTEEYPEQSTDPRPRVYGMRRWCDMFSPRQLLAQLTFLETLLELVPQMEKELGKEKADTVRTYLSFTLDKCAAYNCKNSRWHAQREVVAPQFERHDFSFKWSFVEMNMALRENVGFPWALSQVIDSYKGIANLLAPSRPMFPAGDIIPAKVKQCDARKLDFLADDSIDLVAVDPPYYDNVMYGELSDFFYVWLKRSVGDIYSDWFSHELVDKSAEAVANPAQFKGVRGRDAKLQARRDYQIKMRRVFRECARVVKPEGAMMVMFTHRQVDAWNELALSLLESGWGIATSWPVHTESEHSLHIARKNSARSTILLFCTPRGEQNNPTYWDESLRQKIRSTARERAASYYELGIKGVDLHLAVFGPVLSVLSQAWPIVHTHVDKETGEQQLFAPEEALNLARSEVFSLRREQLIGKRPVRWDAVSEWYLETWDTLGAREIPYDYARRLCLDRGVEEDEVLHRAKLVKRKGEQWVLLEPSERGSSSGIDAKAIHFSRVVDAVQTAMLVLVEDGERACRGLLERAGLLTDTSFKAYVEALIKVIPRTKRYSKGKIVGWNVKEAELLEQLRVHFFQEMEVPQEEKIPSEQYEFDLSEGEDEEEE